MNVQTREGLPLDVLLACCLVLLSACTRRSEPMKASTPAKRPTTPAEVCAAAIAASLTESCKPNAAHADDREFDVKYAGDVAYSVLVQSRPTTDDLEKVQLEDQEGFELLKIRPNAVKFYIARDRHLLVVTVAGSQASAGASKVDKVIDLVGADPVPWAK